MQCSSGRLNRRSASVTRWPPASSAAAMYSMPSGSMRKNGPSPKRSLPEPDVSSRTFIETQRGGHVHSLGLEQHCTTRRGGAIWVQARRHAHGCYTALPALLGVSRYSAHTADRRAECRQRLRCCIPSYRIVVGTPPPRLVVGGVACALLVSIGGRTRLTFDPDVLSLLPRDGRVIPAFREYLARVGSLDQLYVVFTAPEGYCDRRLRGRDRRMGRGACGRAPEIARRRHRHGRPVARLHWLGRSTPAAAARRRRWTKRCGRLQPGGPPARRRAEPRAADACRRPTSPRWSARIRSACFAWCVTRSAARSRAQHRRHRRRLPVDGQPQPPGDRTAAPAAVRRDVFARARRATRADHAPTSQRAASRRRTRTRTRFLRCRSNSPAAIASRSKQKRSSSARAS